MIERMKERWGVGLWGMLAILASFTLAGPTVLLLGRPLLRSILPEQPPLWLMVLAYLIVLAPLYQLLLLGYGTLLGQFRFFWERQKKAGLFLLRMTGLRRSIQN
ncbi:MAG: DUF6787 family protein [Acidobacteriota bacterium]